MRLKMTNKWFPEPKVWTPEEEDIYWDTVLSRLEPDHLEEVKLKFRESAEIFDNKMGHGILRALKKLEDDNRKDL